MIQAAEPDEGRLLLELSQDFWSENPHAVYDAAAQIVFTMANLEGGRAITLIEGLRPGRIETPDGEVVDQPMTRDDFDSPVIQVIQPVAGSTVPRTIPIELALAREQPIIATLEVGERRFATTTIRRGSGRLIARRAPSGDAVVAIELEPQVTVEVPVTLAPRP